MSAFDPSRPRYTLSLAGKNYELLGTFELIEAVEHALQDHIGSIAVRVVGNLPTYGLAKVVSAVLTSCGHKMTAKEAGDLLFGDVGATGEANDALRMHLYAFLSITLAPPAAREQKAKEMGELLGKLTEAVASPGSNTEGSLSAT